MKILAPLVRASALAAMLYTPATLAENWEVTQGLGDVTLVSYTDPVLARAYVSFSVGMGANHEGASQDGLAHLAEHVVLSQPTFDTQRRHESVQALVGRLGGSLNGQTSASSMQFVWSIPSRNTGLVFDRLRRSLRTTPSIAVVTREVRTIRVELESRARSRQFVELKELARIANPDHDWHRAAEQTKWLDDTSPGQLITHLETYLTRVSKQPVYLVVISQHSHEELKALLNLTNSKTPSRERSDRAQPTDLFRDFGVQTVTPNGGEVLELTLWFHLSAKRDVVLASSFLLDHLSGSGKLARYLREQGLATRQSAGLTTISDQEVLLNVRFGITDTMAVDDIVNAFFDFQAVLESIVSDDRYIAEFLTKKRLIDRRSIHQNPREAALTLSRRLAESSDLNALDAGSIGGAPLSDLLAQINPDRLIGTVYAHQQGGQRLDAKRRQGAWTTRDPEQISRLRPMLDAIAPELNPPRELAKRHVQKTGPVTLLIEPNSELSSTDVWFRGVLTSGHRSIAEDALRSILTLILMQRLDLHAGRAARLGDSLQFAPTHSGVLIQLGGNYRTSLARLDVVTRSLQTLKTDPEEFRRQKNRFIDYARSLMGPPSISSSQFRMSSLLNGNQDPLTYLGSIEDLTFSKFNEWLQKFTRKMRLRGVVVGAVPSDYSLPDSLLRSDVTSFENEHVDSGGIHTFVQELSATNSALFVHIEAATDREAAALRIAKPILLGYLKNQLRFRAEGNPLYELKVNQVDRRGKVALLISIGVPSLDLQEPAEYIDRLVSGFRAYLQDFNSESFVVARQLAADAGPKSQRELAKNVLTFHRLTKTRGFTVRDLEGLTAQMTQ
ncbi:MAG: insulinase family protein, partial [Pseudomonadota bacterium]